MELYEGEISYTPIVGRANVKGEFIIIIYFQNKHTAAKKDSFYKCSSEQKGQK